eukprot:scaffold30189_cov33-Phaeocystis_antarctica.AAC.1
MEAASSSNPLAGPRPGVPRPGECLAAQSHQAHPDEAQGPSWGTAKGLAPPKGATPLWPCWRAAAIGRACSGG